MHFQIRPWEIDFLTADQFTKLCEQADRIEREANRG